MPIPGLYSFAVSGSTDWPLWLRTIRIRPGRRLRKRFCRLPINSFAGMLWCHSTSERSRFLKDSLIPRLSKQGNAGFPLREIPWIEYDRSRTFMEIPSPSIFPDNPLVNVLILFLS